MTLSQYNAEVERLLLSKYNWPADYLAKQRFGVTPLIATAHKKNRTVERAAKSINRNLSPIYL